MSYNQWKLLNNLKDTITKFTSDKTVIQNFTKDFLELIQKGPPSLYRNQVLKYFENIGVLKNLALEEKQEETVLPAVKSEVKNKVIPKETSRVAAAWKKNAGVSETCISTRTDQILHSIEIAVSDDLALNLTEQLLSHIRKYPEVRSKAVKIGAVRLFLKLRSNTKNTALLESIREALAILGYADPVPKSGIRILSIDGGGIRGLLVLEMLMKLEELTGQRINQLFDFICGVSTGALLSYAIAAHRRPLDEIASIYETMSREVFKQSSWRGTGSLVWSHSYYDTLLWEKKLKEHLGTITLSQTARDPQCPKICTVSAVVNQTRLSAFLFRNYSIPWKFQSQYQGCCDCEVWQAARASAAAPTYFEEFKLGKFLHQDGGILVNNPTAIAVHEAKLLWPDTPIQCVVSFGTGRSVSSPIEPIVLPEGEGITASATTSWANKFFTILDSATDTEAVHIILNDLLPGNVYYRFNPYLTEVISMVEIDPKKIEQLRRDATMYLRRNEDKFQEVAKNLMQNKSLLRKTTDYIKVQRVKYGI
nr:unnamed protein product [Callosobruchus chinensis]